MQDTVPPSKYRHLITERTVHLPVTIRAGGAIVLNVERDEEPVDQNCAFCKIATKLEYAKIRYEDDEIIAFDNRLQWAPVMLLVIPKQHMTQEDLWKDIGKVSLVATNLGHEFCPNGFRMLSNFGGDAMQSQPHGHIHVVGGAPLGPYVARWSPFF